MLRRFVATGLPLSVRCAVALAATWLLLGGCTSNTDERSDQTSTSANSSVLDDAVTTSSTTVHRPTVGVELVEGTAAHLWTDSSSMPEIAGVVVPIEEEGAVGEVFPTNHHVLRFDDLGERLVAVVPVNFTGCNQVGPVRVERSGDEVVVTIVRGVFLDDRTCTNPGPVTGFVPFDVPGGVGDRALVVSGCVDPLVDCEPQTFTLDRIPRVVDARVGCVPSWLWIDVTTDRNRDRLDRCDTEREAATWADVAP